MMRLFGPTNGVRTKMLLQLSATECGLAALSILFSWYGYSVPIETLRSECGTSRDGNKATTLLKAARHHGFEAEAWRMEPEALRKLNHPAILFWQFRHFVVLDGFRGNKVFINDPAQGPVTVSAELFDRDFTGIVIQLRRGPMTRPRMRSNTARPYLKEWLGAWPLEMIFLLICLTLLTVGPFLYATFSRLTVDQVIIRGHTEWIRWLSIVISATAVLLTITSLVQKWNYFKWSTTAAIVKNAQIIHHLLNLPLIFYTLRQKSEIISIVSRIESIIRTLFTGLSFSLISLINIIASLVLMLIQSPTLTMITLTLTLLFSGISLVVSRYIFPDEQLKTAATGKLYAQTVAALGNLDNIKACGLEDKINKKWQQSLIIKVNSQERIESGAAIIRSLGGLYHGLVALVILWVGMGMINRGICSTGRLMAYYAVFLYFSTGIRTLMQNLRDIQAALPAHQRIQDILQSPADTRLKPPTTPMRLVQNRPFALHCQNVSFSWNQDGPPVLKNVSLHIRQGEQIALVGGTGSGKSTLARLLGGLFLPCEGQITVMDQDTGSLHHAQLAQLFSWVSQDIFLFSGTLYDCLTFGISQPDPALIDQAIDITCLTDLVTERGLYAPVMENGRNFSGGERQRIEIAHALIQNTPALILDEATSALDAETEKKLILNLKNIGKTMIHVAHRLSSIRHCDRIIVLENGTITEQGSHSELIALNGQYQKLLHYEAVHPSPREAPAS